MRLKQKAFDEQTIARTLSFLKEKKFIDDACFAKSWIDARLRKNKGLRRLTAELKNKGVSPDIVTEQIEQARRTFNETEVITRIIGERLAKAKNIGPETAKRRIYAYLLRQGFSPDLVNEQIHQIRIS